MEKEASPMNPDWFYAEENPYRKANEALQQRKWKSAETGYSLALSAPEGNEYDQDMAALNLASAQMAQGKASEHWQAFGKLCGIAAERRLTKERLAALQAGAEDPVVVHSDQVGIGDIAHFLPVLEQLKKSGVKNVQLAVRGFMHKPLDGPSQAYGVPLINEKEQDSVAGDHTHLLALYGLLKMPPADLRSEKALYTTTEKALGKIRDSITSHVDKQIAIVFLGEDRPATLIGGKELPHDPKQHGRQLDAAAFEQLLQEHPNLLLFDCNPAKSRIHSDGEKNSLQISSAYENQIVPLPAEDEPFDSVIALGLIWNQEAGKFVGFAGDNGPPNLFSRTLTKEAQQRFVFIIPNRQEYDMRMEGEGDKYTQMLSYCPIYKCANPEEQAVVIRKAYEDLTKTEPSEAKTEPSAAWYCTVI